MRGIGNVVLGVAMVVTNVSCQHQGADVRNNNVATQATSVAEIQRRWEAESKTLDPINHPEEYKTRKLDMLLKLLEEAPALQKAELERVRREPTPYYDMSIYDKYLLQALFTISARKSDRDALVYLLSAKCPDFIGLTSVEVAVASVKTNEPFLILFESYDAATEDNKPFVLGSIRSAFKGLSEKYLVDDAEFLRKSKVWYQQNVSKIKINPNFHPLGSGEQRELFLSK